MNCIKCGKDLSKWTIFDSRRGVICDDCTFWETVNRGKEMGIELPSERLKRHMKAQTKPRKTSTLRKLAPRGKK